MTTGRRRRRWPCSATMRGRRPMAATLRGRFNLRLEGHPFTVVGWRRRASSARRCAATRPISGSRCIRSRCIDGDGALLHQSVSAWLRMIGRLRPGASTAGMAPRLTGVLRQWMQHDAGYPSNWMPDVIRMLPKQIDHRRAGGRGRGGNEGGVRDQPEDPAGRLRRWCCSSRAPTSRTCCWRAGVARRTQTALRLAVGATRRQIVMQALTESVLLAIGGGIAGLRWRSARPRLLLALAFQHAHFLPMSVTPSPPVLGVRLGAGAVDRNHFRRGAGMAGDADRSGGSAARIGPGDQRPFVVGQQGAGGGAGRLSVVLVAGAHAGAQPGQTGAAGFRLSGRRARDRGDATIRRPTYTMPKLNALYRANGGAAQPAAGRARRRAGAVQSAHQQLGRTDLRGGPSRARRWTRSRRVVGPRERQLPAELRDPGAARPRLHRGR